LGTMGLGWLLPKLCTRFAVKKERPQLWVFGLLIASYALLIPGLFEVLFSFIVIGKLLGFTMVITQGGPNFSPGALTENAFGLVGELVHSGAILGAVLLIFYAMVIPAVKLILLVVGECWRFSYNPTKVQVARVSIRVVQVISKWACPDMFAYILLLYLVRSVGERSPYVETGAKLDVGFLCFSAFCICSTISSLLITLPKRHIEEDTQESPPLLLKVCGRTGMMWAVFSLLFVFVILFVLGLVSPVMALRLDLSQLNLPLAVKPIIKGLDLAEGVDADVTLLDCISALGKWVYSGEASCILALVMLAFFVVGLTALDMILVLLVATGMRPGTSETHGEEETAPEEVRNDDRSSIAGSDMTEAPKVVPRNLALAAAHVVKHVCMLDVFVMAVVIVGLAAGVYRAQGLLISIGEGTWWLLAAELVHLFTYYQVLWAVHYVEEQTEEAAKKEINT